MNIKYAELIAEVGKLIGERGKSYGEPLANMEDIAKFFNLYLKDKKSIEAVDIPVLMILVKVARLMKTPFHDDSAKDVIGYGGILRGIIKNGKAK